MKVCSIVGARPNFIKLAPISKELRERDVEETIIHTGQHYDGFMSDIFFDGLGIPDPNYNLNITEHTHAAQVGKMMIRMEPILESEKPDVVVVFGDTNSTFAGAVTAAKLNIPVAHIEAGCRSYDMAMPEELNRIMVDHISDSLYAPTSLCKTLLETEGVYGHIECFGDVSVDILANMMRYNQRPFANKYILSTVHRASNTDCIENLMEILSALNDSPHEVIFPIHPRTEKIVRKYDLFKKYKNISFMSPFNYHKMIQYLQFSEMVVTDSGGIQKEAYLLKVPCITLRNTTEWHETLEHGWNQLTPIIERGFITNAIIDMVKPSEYTKVFGDVGVSKKIVESLMTLYEV